MLCHENSIKYEITISLPVQRRMLLVFAYFCLSCQKLHQRRDMQQAHTNKVRRECFQQIVIFLAHRILIPVTEWLQCICMHV